MYRITKRSMFFVLLALLLSSLPFTLYGQGQPAQMSKIPKATSAGQADIYAPMPGPGKKVSIGGGYYLIFGFDKKPKLGTVITKVEIFTAEDKKDTSFTVKGDAGMPTMKGAHDMGEQTFKLSNKGDYLLPVNIVMPGDWEIRISVLKDGKVVLRGRYNFDV
jgi:hypothetical protein